MVHCYSQSEQWKKMSEHKGLTDCLEHYLIKDQHSAKVLEDLWDLQRVSALSQLTTESHPQVVIVLVQGNHVDGCWWYAGRHRRRGVVGDVCLMHEVERHAPGWRIGSGDDAETYYRSYVLEVKVTWRTIGLDDDEGPWFGTEGMTDDPGMIVGTADEE